MQVRKGGSYEVDPDSGTETREGGTKQPQAFKADDPSEPSPPAGLPEGDPPPPASQSRGRRAPSGSQSQE